MLDTFTDSELRRAAIFDHDVKKVESLLSVGGDVNLKVLAPWDGNGSLLHHTRSVEITRLLLRVGARVNARNSYGETPLHYAVIEGKKWEVVRELLRCGAHVNAADGRGYTALNRAITAPFCSSRIIKELLEHGADINRSCRGGGSPLGSAVACNMDIAKLLIKHTVLKNCENDCRKIIDLVPYNQCTAYYELHYYFESSVREISRMKGHSVCNSQSLYEIVLAKDDCVPALYPDNELLRVDFGTRYAVYKDCIEKKVLEGVKRALVNKLMDVEVYMVRTSSGGNTQRIALNSDDVGSVAAYLSNEDVTNLITAFDGFDQSGELLHYSLTSTFESHAKRTKLS